LAAIGQVSPLYQTFPGWTEDISRETSFEKLPSEARGYIEFLEKNLGVPISDLSVGPDRSQIIRRPALSVVEPK